MGKPGGQGLTPGDANAAADDARAASPPDRTGLNANTAGDHRVEANNQVCQSEGDQYIEVKGGKGEIKVGGFLEVVVGLKHAMIGGFKTGIDISNYMATNLGPYSTEMFAAKYEILAKKEVHVVGKKTDDYLGFKFEKNNGPWTETTRGKKRKEQALEKEINDAMTQRLGALLESTAAKYEAEAKSAREKIDEMDRKVAAELRVKFENARSKVGELSRNITDMKVKVGKFDRQCQNMNESVSALLEIKGSSTASKASAMKLKASLLKFTGTMVKLGE